MNNKVTRLNSANAIGAFLDQCTNSIMLGYVPGCIVAYINGLIGTVNDFGIITVQTIVKQSNTTYTETLVGWVNNN